MKYKDNKNVRAFTLIELIAVLVILAIIALIVTPLVMNIVKKAKDSANKRSVDAYGKAVELAVATHLLDYGEYPTTLDNLTVEYSGNEVVCNIKTLNEDGSIYLSECSVKGTLVKDTSTEDGYYHYGKTIDAVYQSYKIGDIVTYNGMNFYVIADSSESQDYVTLLKETPLTVDEVNTYGTDENGVNHVNAYATDSTGTAYNQNGYGGLLYYTSSGCNNTSYGDSCKNVYDLSDVKYVVDNWKNDVLIDSDLKEDDLGYKVRLITLAELQNQLGYSLELANISLINFSSENSPSWVYNNNYYYWTMSPRTDTDYGVWYVYSNGSLRANHFGYSNYFGVVRPVINLKKSVI